MADGEGWAQPADDSEFHYFRRKKSLCGRAEYYGPLREEDQAHPGGQFGDCPKCSRKVKKERGLT